MAHPQHQTPHQYAPQRAFPPPQPTPSPQLGGYPPPKRQRMSPNGQSPYSSPNLANGNLPNQLYSSPNYGPSQNGHQPRPDVPNLPPAQAQAGAMGPPSRPDHNKPVDVNDLSDVLAGSGVDLREEEAALVNRYSHPTPQVNGGALASDAAATFKPMGSTGQTASYHTPYANFSTLSPNVPGDRNSFYGGGTFNQPAVSSIETVRQQVEAAKKRELRKKLEREQYHMNDPFLFGNVLNRRLQANAQNLHVHLPMMTSVVEAPPSHAGQSTEVNLYGADGHEVLTVLRGQPIVSEGAISEILTLLSLASQERIRNVVEDTATLAKGRRIGSNGIVAPDLVDLAIGSGNPDPATTLPTPGNSATSPISTSMKRSFSDQAKLPTPASEVSVAPVKTISFPNLLAQAIRKSHQGEVSFEDARAARRSKRTATGLLSGEGGRGPSSAVGTPGPSTPSGQAPDLDSKKAPSKKEQRRQADAKASEAQQHAATNTTTRMALGLGGKKFSWLSGGASSGGGGFPVQRATAASQSQAKTNGAAGGGAGAVVPGKRKFGDFREDRESGRGIQLRDVVTVLEPEPKEKRTLARAYNKMRTKD